jgi:Outer membrane protein beta-barrel domain
MRLEEQKETLMRTRLMWSTGALLIAGLFFSGGSARAQGSFGISAGLYQPDDSDLDRTEVYGLRGGYRFRPSFGFEAALGKVDLADALNLDDGVTGPDFGFDADFKIDLYNLDLSLQWFPHGGNFVVFGGPGVARLDTKVRVTAFGQTFSESDTSNIFTAHLGLAYQWQISDRFFVRPEARVRRYFDDEASPSEDDSLAVSYKATDYEASLILGWRFGG